MPCPSSLAIIMLPCTSTAKISALSTFLPDIPTATPLLFFPHSNLVHMGDDFVTDGFPFIDVESGGSIHGMIDAVQQVVSQLPADVKVIPGHGPVSNLVAVRAYLGNAGGNARCSAEGFERGQDSRPDEAG